MNIFNFGKAEKHDTIKKILIFGGILIILYAAHNIMASVVFVPSLPQAIRLLHPIINIVFLWVVPIIKLILLKLGCDLLYISIKEPKKD